MIPVLVILISLVSGLLTFFFKKDSSARLGSLFAVVATLVLSIAGDHRLRLDAGHALAEPGEFALHRRDPK